MMSRELPFHFEVPMRFFEKADADPGKKRRIGGVVSTDKRDQQDEILLQEGLDFTPFVKKGWFNDNHSKKTEGIVGYPEFTKYFNKGATLPDGQKANRNCHWVEGHLLENYEPADRLWNLGKALQETGRGLGFSVEGSVGARLGKSTVAKATVRNVAITGCPVNDDAKLQILTKSLQVMNEADPDDLVKVLGMGPTTSNTSPEGPKSGMGAGKVLVGESVENDAKKEDEDEDEEKVKKGFTEAEMFAWYRTKFPTASPVQIGRCIQLTYKLKNLGML
jgi:hypothetical protein